MEGVLASSAISLPVILDNIFDRTGGDVRESVIGLCMWLHMHAYMMHTYKIHTGQDSYAQVAYGSQGRGDGSGADCAGRGRGAQGGRVERTARRYARERGARSRS